jgi:uncharacterized membrane protein
MDGRRRLGQPAARTPAADLVLAQDARLGHGHRYGGELASAWAAIAPPPGWTSADTARLVKLIETRG